MLCRNHLMQNFLKVILIIVNCCKESVLGIEFFEIICLIHFLSSIIILGITSTKHKLLFPPFNLKTFQVGVVAYSFLILTES